MPQGYVRIETNNPNEPMETRQRNYIDAIDDCITTLSLLYESTHNADIYNSKVKSVLEKLKDDFNKYPYVINPRQKETSSNDETATEYNAPPLGLVPRHIREQKRITEIKEAIERYIEAGYAIPVEWITEYNELSYFMPIRIKEFNDSLANMNK